MNQYIFILGQSPKLSRQELISFFSDSSGSIIKQDNNFVLVKTSLSADKIMPQLGGTIKIARLVDELDSISELTVDKWLSYINDNLSTDKKINFGFSIYDGSKKNYAQLKQTALFLKKEIKSQGNKARLVVGKSDELSSVIVKKNNLLGNELIVIKNNNKFLLSITEAVQDFATYGQIDMKRPRRDNRSGMLPPKIAQIMINLAGSNRQRSILDPFCGSGTILQQAMMLGFEQIYGTDISKKAVSDSQENLEWTQKTFGTKSKFEIQKADIKNLGQTFKKNSIDLIVTEPFMGDARFVFKQNKISALQNTKSGLQNLYTNAFKEFKKILAPGGQVVFVFPVFAIKNQQLRTLNAEIISNLGFVDQLETEIIYQREKQKVLRQITVYKIK